MVASDEKAAFFSLDLARLPDAFYKPDVSAEEWRQLVTSAGSGGFAPGTLGTSGSITLGVLFERSVTYPIYMMMNAAPFLLPPAFYLTTGLRGLGICVALVAGLHLCCVLANPMRDIRSGQYIYTERNIQKYHSMRMVWPKSLQPPNLPGPKIFCAIPHGLAPVGVVAYPVWSKLFGERLCRWTCAPVVLKLPVISYFLEKVGFVAASTANIKSVLRKDQSVGVVLDGIAGMFQLDSSCEKGYVKERKGIVKIALTTGTPLVPVYCFGVTSLWRIIVDPFGWLERLSLFLNVSVTPFCGRPFGILPFGPPFRHPILTAIGDPIMVPKIEQPSQEEIDLYHGKLMDGFLGTFEQHKASYGWSNRRLQLV